MHGLKPFHFLGVIIHFVGLGRFIFFANFTIKIHFLTEGDLVPSPHFVSKSIDDVDLQKQIQRRRPPRGGGLILFTGWDFNFNENDNFFLSEIACGPLFD